MTNVSLRKRVNLVAVECYIMQGRYPLPQKVIQKFAKTGGELCKNVFLMGKPQLTVEAFCSLLVARR